MRKPRFSEVQEFPFRHMAGYLSREEMQLDPRFA